VFPDVYLQGVAIQEECSLLCSVVKFSTSYFHNYGYWPSTDKLNELLFLSKAAPLYLKVLIIKLIKNKSRNNLLTIYRQTCFGFVSHLKAEYTIVV